MTLGEDMNDKSQWPTGPWTEEPDQLESRYGGLPCLILRSHMGNLCGYVGVWNDHPWYREHYDKINARVHGGLTYSGRANKHVRHTRQEGDRDTDVWFVGFDCAHADDLVPGMLVMYTEIARKTDESMKERFPQWEELKAMLPSFMRESVYRDIPFVKREIMMLADQALEAATLKGRVRHVAGKIGQAVQDAKWSVKWGIREMVKPSPPPPPELSEEKLFALKARRRRDDDE